MNFWQVLIRVLPRRPIPALGALWWHATGRRVRARNRLRAAGAAFPFAYEFWRRNIEQAEAVANRATAVATTWAAKPRFTVIIDAKSCPRDAVEASVQSLVDQIYSGWDAFVLSDGPNVPGAADARIAAGDSWQSAIARGDGDYIVPLRAGDRLARSALFRFAEALREDPGAEILYGDDDEVDARGRRLRPFFKPAWNEELFLAQDYLSRACAIGRQTAEGALRNEGVDRYYDASRLLIEALASAPSIKHVPHIVAHLPPSGRLPNSPSRLECVGRYVEECGATVRIGPFESVKVEWPLPNVLPLVSIIVPTRDKVELLRSCIESLLAKTAYRPFEILIIDNASTENRTFEYLGQLASTPSVRVVRYPGAYNYSAINNHAAREANGAYLCLLNNDTEIVNADWLTEMMRYAERPDVGAVGAKLLYPDGTIQHAGVVVGIGEAAGHAHRNLPASDRGYFALPHLPQFVSAVTGACLLVDKRKFLAVGGLDEQYLPIAFNDVDLCLKLQRAGLRNVYVPHAVLIHHESKSRAKDHSKIRIEPFKRELRIFQERWGTKDYRDPLLNPNLDPASETFVIRF